MTSDSPGNHDATGQDCFIMEGVRYRVSMGILAKRQLKPNVIPTRFTKPTHGESKRSTPPCKKKAFE